MVYKLLQIFDEKNATINRLKIDRFEKYFVNFKSILRNKTLKNKKKEEE
jgi:hypothetical protein